MNNKKYSSTIKRCISPTVFCHHIQLIYSCTISTIWSNLLYFVIILATPELVSSPQGNSLQYTQNCMYMLTYMANDCQTLEPKDLKLGLHMNLNQVSKLDNVRTPVQDSGDFNIQKSGSGCSEFIHDSKNG